MVHIHNWYYQVLRHANSNSYINDNYWCLYIIGIIKYLGMQLTGCIFYISYTNDIIIFLGIKLPYIFSIITYLGMLFFSNHDENMKNQHPYFVRKLSYQILIFEKINTKREIRKRVIFFGHGCKYINIVLSNNSM